MTLTLGSQLAIPSLAVISKEKETKNDIQCPPCRQRVSMIANLPQETDLHDKAMKPTHQFFGTSQYSTIDTVLIQSTS